MRPSRIALALSLVFLCAPIAANAGVLCFQRGTDMWIANADGTNARKLGRGSSPEISPDGKRVAFHTDSDGSGEIDRRIALIDVADGKRTVFKQEVPSANSQRAIWSPDGKQILFNIHADADWHLGTINADGSGFRYLKKAAPKLNSYWSACWAPDGESFYAQDLRHLYQFSRDGSELRKWSIDALFPNGGFSSGSRIVVSPDGRKLAMAVDIDEPFAMDDWEGPPSSIWTLDLGSGKATRLTPPGTLAFEPWWSGNNEILFAAQGEKEKQPAIYRMTATGDAKKLVVKNASMPSESR